MAVTNEEINTWLQANAGASDADIAAAMGQYGVTPAQMAQATGLGQDVVQSRYDAATAPAFTPAQIANAPGVGASGIGVSGEALPGTQPFTLGQATMPGVETRYLDLGESMVPQYFVKGTDIQVDEPSYTENNGQSDVYESVRTPHNLTIYDDAQQGEHVYTPDGKYLGFVHAPRDDSFFGTIKEIVKETAPIWSAALGYVPAAAPYVAAAKAIKAVDEGNLGAAIVSGLTATQGFGSDLGLSPSTMETLKQAKTATQVVNALESENPFAVINALSQTDTGKTLLNSDVGNGVTLGKVLDTANVAAAAKSGDPFQIASAIDRATRSKSVAEQPLTQEELLQLGENRLNKMFAAGTDVDAEDAAVAARTQEILDELAAADTPSEYEDFLRSIGITSQSDLGESPSNQEILDAIFYEAEMGDKPKATGLGTVEVVGERIPPEDFRTIDVVGERPAKDEEPKAEGPTEGSPTDLGEVEIVGERPVTPSTVTPPVVTPPVVTPPVVTPPTVTPPKVTPKQVAKMLGVPVSSPVVQDVIEALYGTMEYVDVGEEFEPSQRKVAPAATQKQLQQTKMAQGGYLDNLLAENMSADDLLNLLR